VAGHMYVCCYRIHVGTLCAQTIELACLLERLAQEAAGGFVGLFSSINEFRWFVTEIRLELREWKLSGCHDTH
jgi:hypothetical protein